MYVSEASSTVTQMDHSRSSVIVHQVLRTFNVEDEGAMGSSFRGPCKPVAVERSAAAQTE